MFSPHFRNVRRASTTIDSVSEGRFLIIERIDFSPEFALLVQMPKGHIQLKRVLASL